MKDLVKFLENKAVFRVLVVAGVILSALIMILLPDGAFKFVILLIDVVATSFGVHYLVSSEKPQWVTENIAWISGSIVVAIVLFCIGILISAVSLVGEHPGAFLFILIFGIVFSVLARKHFKKQKQN